MEDNHISCFCGKKKKNVRKYQFKIDFSKKIIYTVYVFIFLNKKFLNLESKHRKEKKKILSKFPFLLVES